MDGWITCQASLAEQDLCELPSELWEILLASPAAKSEETNELIDIALRSTHSGRSLVLRAKLDSALSQDSVRLPRNLAAQLGFSSEGNATLFGCSIKRTTLFPLHDLILSAQDGVSYAFAQSSPGQLGELLAKDRRILRQNEVLELKIEDGSKVSFQIIMTEPILQGYFDLQRTSFTVLAPQTSTKELQNGHADYGNEDLFQELSVDESFLGQDLFDLGEPLPSFKQMNGEAPESSNVSHISADKELDNSWHTCTCSALSVPLDQLQYLSQSNQIGTWDHSADLLVRTRDLLRFGLFAGDYALVSSAQLSQPRIVRVWSADAFFSVQNIQAQMLLPPLLLQNISPSSQTTLNKLKLKPARKINPLRIPTVKSLTIARIASPLSTHKAFQPLFLRGLKEFFRQQGVRRLVKEGDLIVVPIDENEARWASEEDQSSSLIHHQRHPTALIYFRIVSLTLKSATGSDFSDVAEGLFGAFALAEETKLIQAGLEYDLKPPEPESGLAQACNIDLTMQETDLSNKMASYLSAILPERASRLDLQVSFLLQGPRGVGKQSHLKVAAAKVGLEMMMIDCADILGETEVKTEGTLRARMDRAVESAPCLLVLTNIELLARKAQAVENGQDSPTVSVLQDCLDGLRKSWRETRWPVVLAATTTDPDKLPAGIISIFKSTFSLGAPDEKERLAILKSTLKDDILAPDVSLRSVAIQTAALVAGDLVDLAARVRQAALKRVQQAFQSDAKTADLQLSGISLTGADFSIALDKARTSYSESIGAPKIPNVTWDDVGGLANVKADILDTIQLPLERPELFADGLKKRSGILLYGPPGTGKTLLAKAVATSCSLNFFSVKGPELLNMYIGESEANVRRVFQRARDAKPCVIFFDELDSVAPKRGNQGDSGGVMDRIVSQLLAELDGMSDGEGGADVFVIGATNRPDLLDPALLRPGRFDRMLYLGVSDEHEAQLRIIQALTRKFKLHPSTDLRAIANDCPFNYTGADFYALCSDAMLKAMSRIASEVDERIATMNSQPPYSNGVQPLMTPQYYLSELATPSEIEILVAQEDFQLALSELVPSVSRAEMDHYAQVQKRFSSSSVSAKKEGKRRA